MDRRAEGPPTPAWEATADDVVRDDVDDETTLERIGRYTIARRLGAGGMGVVFLAHDPELDRHVAVKLVRCEGRLPVGAHARLGREAQALAQLSHPNVTAVFDVGESRDGLFVAMEYIEGVTLTQWLRRPRTWREIVDVFAQAGRGLAAAHRVGLVHRDFKPDNVMLGDDGRVRVLDFGLAVLREDVLEDSIDVDGDSTLRTRLTMTGAVMGTPMYMAPEQHHGEAPDARSDQYSFCVALYEALYGERPFDASTHQQLALAKAIGPRAPTDASVPRWLRRVVLRGLAPRPADRWPSMDALLRATRPRRIGSHALAIAALALGVPAAGIALGVATREDDLCRESSQRLEQAWRSEQMTVQSAMLRSKVAYAGDTWTRVEENLDAYATGWRELRRTACEAAVSEATNEDVDGRIACLERAAIAFEATLDVLANEDAPVVEHAMQAVAGLPSLEGCDSAAVIAPPEPALVGAVDEARIAVAQARALETAGQYATGLELARQSVEQAEATGYPPVLAEALVVLGKVAMRSNAVDEAAAALERAAAIGVEVRHDGVALEAMLLLAAIRGYLQVRTDEGLHWWRSADSIAQRGVDLDMRVQLLNVEGSILFRREQIREAKARWLRSLALLDDPQTPAQRHLLVATLNNLGSIHAVEGSWAEAESSLRRAVDEASALHGPQHPVVTTAMVNLANVLRESGQFDAALRLQEEAVRQWEHSLGPEHPYVATALANLAMLARSAGETDAALAYFERSIAIKRAALGDRHPDLALSVNNYGDLLREVGRAEEARVAHLEAAAIWRLHGDSSESHAYALTNLGYDLVALGRPEEALPLLEEALDIAARWQLSPQGHAETQLALARTLAILDRDPDRARALAIDAERTLDRVGGRYLALRDEARAWLAEHPD